jgi:hypothetical protein
MADEIAEAVVEILDDQWSPVFGGPTNFVFASQLSNKLANRGIRVSFAGPSIHVSAIAAARRLFFEIDAYNLNDAPMFVYGETGEAGLFDWANPLALARLDSWARTPQDFIARWGKAPSPSKIDGSRIEWLDTKTAKRVVAGGVARSMQSGGQTTGAALTLGAGDYTVHSVNSHHRVLWSFPLLFSPNAFGSKLSTPVSAYLEDGLYCFGGDDASGAGAKWDSAIHLAAPHQRATQVTAF